MAARSFPRSDSIEKLGKSSEECHELRIAGNKHYAEGNYMKALIFYTRAIGKGEENSVEISLAYGNRSAVTFLYDEYNDSLIDIDRAIGGKYPEEIVYKLYERKGDCLAALNKLKRAIGAFQCALREMKKGILKPSKALEIKTRVLRKLNETKTARQAQNFKQTAKGAKHLFKLSHPQSDIIECASVAVGIEHSDEMGRMVVAKVDIKPGDVLAVEKPSAYLLLEDRVLFCDFCLQRCHSLISCSTCDRVFYCNITCRGESWKRSHEVECALFPALMSIGCGHLELLAVRCLIMMTKQGKILDNNYLHFSNLERDKKNPIESRGFKDGKYLSGNIETAFFLQTNEDLGGVNSCCSEYLMDIVMNAGRIFKTLKSSKFFNSTSSIVTQSTPVLDGETKLSPMDTLVGGILLNFLLLVPCNALDLEEMTVSNDGKRFWSKYSKIGSGIYNFLSLFNNSCDPNVLRTTLPNGEIVVTALATIKKGEQVVINYVKPYTNCDLELRQKCYYNKYFFTCKCTPCVEKWPVFNDMSRDENFLPGVKASVMNPFFDILNFIFERVSMGDNDYVPFLIQLQAMIEKTYKKPSKTYCFCQAMIKNCMYYQGKHYINKYTTL